MLGQNSRSATKRKRRWNVALVTDAVCVKDTGSDVVDGQPEENMVYVSNDEDPLVAMRLSQLRRLVKNTHVRVLRENRLSHSENKIPTPYYQDTIQLRCDQSNVKGGCFRIAAEELCPGLLSVDAMGYLFDENTLFVFHEPLWTPAKGSGCEFFFKAVHRDRSYCLVKLEDGTIALKSYEPNSTNPIPLEARLLLEQYGELENRSSYRYRFKFLHGDQSSEKNISYYIGAFGNGVAGVFEEDAEYELPAITTFFKINFPKNSGLPSLAPGPKTLSRSNSRQ